MVSGVVQDTSFAIRQFRRSPGFASAVILTLALGIGATTAIFSLVDGILLRPLAFPEAERLVAIGTMEFPPGAANNPQGGYSTGSSYPNFFDWQRQNHTFESVASYDYVHRLFAKANGDGGRVIAGGRVSANLFSTLGVAPELGRSFTADEERPGHRVVILSHELWVSDFASSPDVIGQTVKVSDEPSVIVGVMPAGFHYAIREPALFWATFAADAEGPDPHTAIRDWDRLEIVGRLKPGVTISQALADLNAIQRGLSQQYPEDRLRTGVSVDLLLNAQVSDARPALRLLLGAVGLVLLIGCANVAGLLLARAASRRPEVAVRTALGASRIRVVRQLLIESLLLAIAGGIAGVLASYVLLRVGLRYVPADVPRLYEVALNGRVLAFAVILSTATAFIFGLLPAWRISKSDPGNALREAGPGMTSGRGRNRLHHALVVAETALGFSLLVGSGLMIRSMLNIIHLDPGFDTKQTVYFDVALTEARYPGERKVAFYRKLLPELAAMPGVERVGSAHPMAGLGTRGVWTNFSVTGHVSSPDDLPAGQACAVMPGYFETISVPLLRGRVFTEHDNDPKSPPVAIINRRLAHLYFPNEDPVGKFLIPKFEHTTEPLRARQIIGVIGDTRGGDPWEPYESQFYLPYAQVPSHQRPIVVMKVRGDLHGYESAVRAAVAEIDKEALVFGYSPLANVLAEQAVQPRFEAALLSGFGGMALFLSSLGLYAVLSYVVSERLRELGLRMAFGASPNNIFGIVLRRALVLGVLGIVAGAFASLVTSRMVGDFLLSVNPLDAPTFVVVSLILLFVSLLSAIVPALRAARVNPMRILREQ